MAHIAVVRVLFVFLNFFIAFKPYTIYSPIRLKDLSYTVKINITIVLIGEFCWCYKCII